MFLPALATLDRQGRDDQGASVVGVVVFGLALWIHVCTCVDKGYFCVGPLNLLRLVMCDLTLKRMWCLNEEQVPLAESTVVSEDIHHLTESGSNEDVKVLLLNLKANTGPWIDKALKLKPRVWNYCYCEVPLAKESKEAILKVRPANPFLRPIKGLAPQGPQQDLQGAD